MTMKREELMEMRKQIIAQTPRECPAQASSCTWHHISIWLHIKILVETCAFINQRICLTPFMLMIF